MPIHFEKLCIELQLAPEQGNPEQLHKLKHWCHHHISTDISYSGDPDVQYKHYLNLAKEYLENFLPQISKDKNEVLEFKNMNTIQFAAYQGYDRYLNNLILPKEAWNEANTFGMTALHLAAVKGHVHTVKILLAKGADAQKTNNELQLPIYSALLVPVSYEENLLHKKEELFHVLKHETPGVMKHQDRSGDSILHIIAAYGFYNLAKNLLEESTELAFLANNYGVYPIHTAILNQRPNLVRLLLDIKNGAALTDAEGKSPLHYAVLFGTREIIELCCQKAPDINARDQDGRTPLMLAAEARNGNPNIQELLLNKGAHRYLT
ncbi:Ankyrin repeat protein [Legionella steigerwaltii]|uniref:Ankyrin repeat protein n=1 Tax=Legionella steigerwaltii TaxID=460 RepID=A0A378LAQ6_9GAMM|nr:ankyrin repeat domain-containing protein [Legionella steigerwaltii]KTD71630.1 Ankyrin repeat protein [Legionella steigerwaltii]STY23794.1 Ankyrin repeat protein [Legionella steigerwaltii]